MNWIVAQQTIKRPCTPADVASAPAFLVSDEADFIIGTSCGLASKFTPEEVLATCPTGAGLPMRKLAGEWLRQ
jgi:NAD(P)-dependent dehydrogenase (short-subunit alcohol dehydrogenase family)